MQSFWDRMTPRFFVYLMTLGFRLARYYALTMLKLDARSMTFSNREGNHEYDFELPNRVDIGGVTAVIRAKNEEDKIGYCLGSIYDVFDQIVIIDNGSTDRTRDVIDAFKRHFDPVDKITVVSYPFVLARNGPEHMNTPPDSVKSIVYFSNYALSFVRRRCVCKWDADMVLRADEKEAFAAFLKNVGQGTPFRWAFMGQTLYKNKEGEYLTSSEELARETRIFPLSYFNRFVKHQSFEVMYSPLYRKIYNRVVFYELKFADSDEFSHWSTKEFPTERKRREWENLGRLAHGQRLGVSYETMPVNEFTRNIAYNLNQDRSFRTA